MNTMVDSDTNRQDGVGGRIVSLADYRARRAGNLRDLAEILPIRPAAPGLSPRQAAHRRRMLLYLAGLRDRR